MDNPGPEKIGVRVCRVVLRCVVSCCCQPEPEPEAEALESGVCGSAGSAHDDPRPRLTGGETSVAPFQLDISL